MCACNFKLEKNNSMPDEFPVFIALWCQIPKHHLHVIFVLSKAGNDYDTDNQ